MMARSPDHEPERIKSRLSPVLPNPSDRKALYEAFLADTLATARTAAVRRDAAVRVAFTPGSGGEAFARFGVAPEELLPQRGETLGDRERHLFEDLHTAGWRRVIAIGSDLPTLPPAHVVEALDALNQADPLVALGPSADGGYYLIGLNANAPEDRVPDLFSTIRWSTAHTLADTLRAAEAAGLPVRLIAPWHDIDEPDDLARLRAEIAGPAAAARAPATAQALRRLSAI